MKFKNTTGEMKIVRFGENHFRDVNPGDVVELPKDVGERLGFSIIREGVELKDAPKEKEKPKPKGRKPKKDKKFFNKLLAIDGIGKKTAEDILASYKNEKNLRAVIKAGEHLAVRDDIAEILKKEFSEDKEGDMK